MLISQLTFFTWQMNKKVGNGKMGEKKNNLLSSLKEITAKKTPMGLMGEVTLPPLKPQNRIFFRLNLNEL
jgi:hypothetical protein